MPRAKPTRLPVIEPMTAKAAALLELMARAITKIIPTKGDPIKKTWATPLRMKFIVPEIGSIKTAH